jgi:hypothetical protein
MWAMDSIRSRNLNFKSGQTKILRSQGSHTFGLKKGELCEMILFKSPMCFWRPLHIVKSWVDFSKIVDFCDLPRFRLSDDEYANKHLPYAIQEILTQVKFWLLISTLPFTENTTSNFYRFSFFTRSWGIRLMNAQNIQVSSNNLQISIEYHSSILCAMTFGGKWNIADIWGVGIMSQLRKLSNISWTLHMPAWLDSITKRWWRGESRSAQARAIHSEICPEHRATHKALKKKF